MAKNSQAPQFGNWEDEDNTQYTTYFEKAVKGKKGNKLNQNGPQEYDTESRGTPKHSRRTSREESEFRRPIGSPLHSEAGNPKPAIGTHQQREGGIRGSDMHRPRHLHQVSLEEGDMRKPVNSNANQKSAQNSPYHRHGGGTGGGETPKRGGRQSLGSDRSIERSPLHPHSQAKAGGRAGAISSPSWERKGLSDGQAPLTPGRSRLRSVTKGDGSSDHGPAVPKFAEWDETDPSSAEGFTGIFDKVREEKRIGAGKVPSMPNEKTSYANGQKRISAKSSKGCGCFPWSR